MKEISLPETIVGLPHPWCITSATQRRQQIEILKYSSDEVKTVLNVLEQCLQALSELTLPPGDSIPESLRECWDFSAEWLAEKMPTVDDFDLIKVKEVLKEEGIESPSELMIEEVAESWLWSVGQDIANTTLRWVDFRNLDYQWGDDLDVHPQRLKRLGKPVRIVVAQERYEAFKGVLGEQELRTDIELAFAELITALKSPKIEGDFVKIKHTTYFNLLKQLCESQENSDTIIFRI